MFDTYVTQPSRTEYVPYEKTVTVNRAPTDKSVELLNEFQEKAKGNIIETILIQDNILNGVAIFFSHDILMQKLNYMLKYTINGKEFKHKGEVDRFEYPYIGTSDPMMKFLILRDFFVPRFSEKIAESLVQESANTLLNSGKP